MKLSYTRIVTPLVALTIALGLGACSRTQHGAGSVTGPSRGGAGTEIVSGCPSLIANDPNSAFDMIAEFGAVVAFRSNRLRIENVADATEIQVLAMGPCLAADAPTITVTGAHANVFLHGTNHSITTTGSRLTFGAVLPVGTNVEPGILLTTDAQGNVFEFIFPELAGLGTGSPRIRVQLARWNLAIVNSATSLDLTYDFVVSQNGVQTHFMPLRRYGHRRYACDHRRRGRHPAVPRDADRHVRRDRECWRQHPAVPARQAPPHRSAR